VSGCFVKLGACMLYGWGMLGHPAAVQLRMHAAAVVLLHLLQYLNATLIC
jgi:hypothetical protein